MKTSVRTIMNYISTGALFEKSDDSNLEILGEIIPKLSCDGIEFMMEKCWYDQIEGLLSELEKLQIDIPVMHFDKCIGEDIANGNMGIAIEHFEINCQIAKEIKARKAVFHLWNGKISDQKIDANILAYNKLRTISDKYGIQLLIENVVCNTHDPFSNWNLLHKNCKRIKKEICSQCCGKIQYERK